jgi:methionyl-tRNA formyltransferase
VAAFSQPARPRGRGLAFEQSAVESLARRRGLRVETPERWTPETTRLLSELRPDVFLTAAYGIILPGEALAVPGHGCLNVHASLLPRWRGAAPIQRAIEAGDAETGITIFRIEEGVDTGPMLARHPVPIAPDETAVTLTTKLEATAAEMLPRVLEEWRAGRITPEPQDHALAVRASKVRKEDGRLSWNRSAIEIERKWRAFQPWPGVTVGGVRLVAARPAATHSTTASPGEVVSLDPLVVATSAGAIQLDFVQEPGRHAVPGPAWARGRRLAVGAMMP